MQKMSDTTRKTILISEPHAFDAVLPYLPYVWATLKSYWEHHGSFTDAYEWLDPVYRCVDASELLQPYEDTPIDVLGLSCYTWNWNLQCQIAQEVKARNPHCLVVAGGPEPDYEDPDFFRKYPYIDVIAVKDGEITFTNILKKLIEGEDDFTDIGGLYLPTPDRQGHICTGFAEVPTVYNYSPYVEQSDYFEKLLRDNNGEFAAIMETNRGCPYSCSFCDWGSNTMSKIRRFDMERVSAEIDWFGRMNVMRIFIADANLGILPRDIEIAELLKVSQNRYGSPRYLMTSYAKNNPDRAVEIAQKFSATGLQTIHQLAIQHTHPEVLAATDRQNISVEKQIEVVRQLMAHDVPIEAQLILGIPGDTYHRWKSCFADLMEWGIHGYYWVFHYHLLPNAPAAARSYLDEWEIETIERYTFTIPLRKRKREPIDPVINKKQKLIVKTKTYSQADWVQMNTYTAFLKALHNCSLTQHIAIYLRFTHNVSYREFYENLIEDFCARVDPAKAWWETVQNHFQAFLENEEAIDYMDVEQYPDLQYQLNPSRWIFVQICFQFDRFFDALKAFLVERYPYATHLESLIDYQKNLVILPSYDRDSGEAFATELDWIRYFEEARKLITFEPLSEPEATPGAFVKVSDVASGDKGGMQPLDWNSASSQQARWARWLECTVLYRNSVARNNFQQLELHKSMPKDFNRKDVDATETTLLATIRNWIAGHLKDVGGDSSGRYRGTRRSQKTSE
jgi:putative methyltransferase